MTRATDAAGQVQPEKVPFISAGFLYNAVHPHPVVVTGQDPNVRQESPQGL